jgi:hypothetical protein
MNEIKKSIEKWMDNLFEDKTYLFTYSLIFIIYTVLNIILLYLTIISFQKIISSTLVDLIISMYFKDKLLTTTALIGLGSALTLLIGYISSENEEKVNGKEGKLLSGIGFWHRFLTSGCGLILIIAFANTYYKGLDYHGLLISIILIAITTLLWIHFKDYLRHVYDWNTLENKNHRIFLDIILGGVVFNIGFFFYIYSLQDVQTLVYNIFNLWLLFINVIFLVSFKYPRTQKIIIKYSNNREEYAHLVRMENGFVRIITKESISKQINLNEVKQLNYDNKYIENFKKNTLDS